MNRTQVKTALIAIGAFVVLQVIGGLLFMVSGTYNIAADEPHLTLVRWMLQAGRTRAVEMRSHGLHPPNLRDPALLKHGFVLYQKNCQPCHGAPGTANQQLGRGINPKPPPLLTASNKWNDSELFWIASHGLKLSGMPGFAPRLSETDVWGIIAFLRRVVLLSPPDYQRLATADDPGLEKQVLDWPANSDYGFAQLRAQGDANRGLQLIHSYGCNSCHTIPGLAPPGRVGPPLTKFAERQYIAGWLVNVPSNAVNWIENPKQFKPQTVMPNLHVQPVEALHITAYLYTSGRSDRLRALERLVRMGKISTVNGD